MIAEDDPLARGRARVNCEVDGLRIVIPARREWPLLAFITFWLCAWTVGGVTVITQLVSGGSEDGAGTAFQIFWLGGWALGMAFAVTVLVWGLLGRETGPTPTAGRSRPCSAGG